MDEERSPIDDFDSRVRSKWSSLRASEQVVADYLLKHRIDVMFDTATNIAEATKTSDATVVRTARALGYSGLPDLKRRLGIEVTRAVDPVSRLEATLESSSIRTTGPIAAVLTDAEETHGQMRASVQQEDLERALEILSASTRVLTWGLGSSKTAAQYAAERLGRAGISTDLIDQTGFNLANRLINVRESDSLLIFVPGRPHKDLMLMLTVAEKKKVGSVLVCNSLSPDIRSMATHVIDLPFPNTKLTTELLSQVLLIDMLANLYAATHPQRAKAARAELTEYRNFIG